MSVFHPFYNQRILYQSLLAGQDAAFEYLYKLLYHRISGYIFATGGNPTDTKTVVHESIITLVFNLHYQKYAWQEEAELMTYVTSIARNKWSEMRRQVARQVPIEADDQLNNADNPYQTAADEQDFEQRRLAVEKNLALMGDKCRRCIDLFYFQQKTMHEIAALLGWASDDVAKKEKYRCLKKLRQLVGLSNWND